MWPVALQLSRDECRAILRRLELESYSQIMNVFRAQGGISETKGKMLEELRSILHISQERHRAEARRVANDEQFATIAEIISGPNTWQEWSREGRRPYPLLPRVAPQTALAIVSKSIAAETAEENKKLPYPALTAQAAAEENAMCLVKHEEDTDFVQPTINVVTSDPFKMPDIPSGPKKMLKRGTTDLYGGSSKKRLVSETNQLKAQQKSQQIVHDFHSIQQNRRNIANRVQQSFGIKQTSPKKHTQSPTKRLTADSARKSGKRTQKHSLKQLVDDNNFNPVDAHTHGVDMLADGRRDNQFASITNLADVPQIAVSKKDIAKNMSKLQIPIASLPSGAAYSNAASASMPEHTLGSLVSSPTKQFISTPVQKYIVEDRQPTTTAATPVANQNVPIAVISPPALTPTITAFQTQPQVSSTPQVMMLPQTSAGSPKLRAVSTTILPTGSKLNTKKLPPGTIVGTLGSSGLDVMSGGALDSGNSTFNQTQVFSLLDSNVSNMSAGLHNLTTSPAVPSHTPPAVIQIQSSMIDSKSNSNLQAVSPTQAKMNATKIVPIMLGAGSTPNINNGPSIIAAGGSSATFSSVSNTSTTASLIKPLTSNVTFSSGNLSIAPGGSSSSGIDASSFMPIASAGVQPVFRKTPNIIRTNYITSPTSAGKYVGVSSQLKAQVKSPVGGGPQILSNIKLPPTIIPATTGASGSITTTHQFLQQQVKNAQASVIRPNVKICQSPNGKVFITPANLDASSRNKLQTVSLQRGSPGAGVFPIRNVKIIGSTSAAGGLTTNLSMQKSSLRIFPIGSRRASISTIMPLSKASNIVTSTSNFISKTAAESEMSKPNVLVIGHSSSKPIVTTLQKNPTKLYEGGTNSGLHNNTLITEDTPIDILNLPIIVDNDGSVTDCGAAVGDTVTLLPTNVMEPSKVIASSSTTTTVLQTPITAQSTINTMKPSNQPLLTEKFQTEPTIALDATDWEMELDQATANAAASQQNKRTLQVQCLSTSTLSQEQNRSVGATSANDDQYDEIIEVGSEDSSAHNNSNLETEDDKNEYIDPKKLNVLNAEIFEDTDHNSENMELDDDINNAMAFAGDVQQNAQNNAEHEETAAINESLHDNTIITAAETTNLNVDEKQQKEEQSVEIMSNEKTDLANSVDMDAVEENENALLSI